MTTFPHTFGVPKAFEARQDSPIDLKLGLAKDKLPSSLLLTHATEYFNLGNDPRWAIIPDSVKWQLLHAASAYKDSCGIIHLSSGEFGVEHLSVQDLAFLYRIIRSYYITREKHVYGEHAIFHRHIEHIEARFEAICKSNLEEGRAALLALRALEDEGLFPLAMRLDKILSIALQPAPEPTYIDARLANALQTIKLEMSQSKVDATYPSGLLLLFAEQNYNLIRLPDEVKWQLLHAAKAHKDKNKIVRLGENFVYEHLTHEHLASLLMILTDYHGFEKKAKGDSNALFSKHIFVIEGHFENLCWKDYQVAQKVIAALQGADGNSILTPFIQKLEKILVNKDRYLAIPNTFENNPNLIGVFSAKSPEELKITLFAYGPKAVMTQVKASYDDFMRWMKTISDMEDKETDPIFQKAVRRWKSEIQERFYNKHHDLICQIYDAFPELFKNTFARWNSLAILNEGARIIIDKFTKKGSIKEPVVICSSYQDYREKLRAIANRPVLNGEWFFSIRCESDNPYEFGVHQTGAYVERLNGVLFVQILDSGYYDYDNGPYRVATMTREAAPFAVLGSPMSARQKDFNNCAFFMFCDMKAVTRNKLNIQYLRNKSINILEYVSTKSGRDSYDFWMEKVPLSNRDMRITVEVPLDFMAPTQSLSLVNAAIRKPEGPNTPQSIAKLKEKITRHKLIEMSVDSGVTGADVSGYTKLKAMKYRLYIVQETFQT